MRMEIRVYNLKPLIIKQIVPKKSVGSYRLGIFSEEQFDVLYFGRSDTNLQRRLLQHSKDGKFSHFTFELTDSLLEAYRLECRDWHMKIPFAKNCTHPFAPKRLPYACPYCLVKKMFNFWRWKKW